MRPEPTTGAAVEAGTSDAGTGVYASAAGTQSVTWLDAHFARSKVVFEFGT
jgi:hypothetical protein